MIILSFFITNFESTQKSSFLCTNLLCNFVENPTFKSKFVTQKCKAFLVHKIAKQFYSIPQNRLFLARSGTQKISFLYTNLLCKFVETTKLLYNFVCRNFSSLHPNCIKFLNAQKNPFWIF